MRRSVEMEVLRTLCVVLPGSLGVFAATSAGFDAVDAPKETRQFAPWSIRGEERARGSSGVRFLWPNADWKALPWAGIV
jgi:hypothetical protein